MSKENNYDKRSKEDASSKGGIWDLYKISESETGGYDVILPGFILGGVEGVAGYYPKNFKSKEEAEEAVEEARERVRITTEKISLEKSFGKFFWKIEELPEGKYKVVLPGLILGFPDKKSEKPSKYLGWSYKEFDSWDKAKEYYLQERENDERLTRGSILELKVGQNETIAFSDFDAYDPRVAPTNSLNDVSPLVEKHIMKRDSNRSGFTYDNTVEKKGWQRELFLFISSYCGEGDAVVEKLGIKRLDALTPKQALELATWIVIDLTKYNREDVDRPTGTTEADQKTVIELLKEGRVNKKDRERWEKWQGNGVCRNFADALKAVFEALKASQTKFSQLNNTYVLREGGTGYDPRRERQGIEHAWNTFVTVSKSGVDATVTDVTWAKRDFETKEIKKADHTLTRMEGMVHGIAAGFNPDTPKRSEQLQQVLAYYLLKYDQIHSSGENGEAEKKGQFFLSRAVLLFREQGEAMDVPPEFADVLAKEYLKIVEKENIGQFELEGLWQIWQKNKQLPFHEILLKQLKKGSNHHKTYFSLLAS